MSSQECRLVEIDYHDYWRRGALTGLGEDDGWELRS